MASEEERAKQLSGAFRIPPDEAIRLLAQRAAAHQKEAALKQQFQEDPLGMVAEVARNYGGDFGAATQAVQSGAPLSAPNAAVDIPTAPTETPATIDVAPQASQTSSLTSIIPPPVEPPPVASRTPPPPPLPGGSGLKPPGILDEALGVGLGVAGAEVASAAIGAGLNALRTPQGSFHEFQIGGGSPGGNDAAGAAVLAALNKISGLRSRL